ncbi:unnamed protein product [Pelagomonas calceolata]|uniref:Uncharacterized protein n=1 Tax=Pelagomonas calceolata TaxID=35677 RepID=A0A8J2SWC0_9STRA|nr:unnamed protein product [Pelagomonas calceolata]
MFRGITEAILLRKKCCYERRARYQDNASSRQDVVLDARDVDVAVRAVALHGEELEVPPKQRRVDLGEGQRVALVGRRAQHVGCTPLERCRPERLAERLVREVVRDLLIISRRGGEGEDAVELGARDAAGRVRDLDHDVRVVVGVGDDDRHLAEGLARRRALHERRARRVPQHIPQDLVEVPRQERDGRALAAAEEPEPRQPALRVPRAPQHFLLHVGDGLDAHVEGRHLAVHQPADRGLRVRAQLRGLRVVERPRAEQLVGLEHAVAVRIQAAERPPEVRALALGREAAGPVLAEQQPQRQPLRVEVREEGVDLVARRRRAVQPAAVVERAEDLGAHGPARLAHLVERVAKFSFALEERRARLPPPRRPLRRRAHLRDLRGRGAVPRDELVEGRQARERRRRAVLEAHGHAREERRQHAVQVRARAAPVRDLARELF